MQIRSDSAKSRMKLLLVWNMDHDQGTIYGYCVEYGSSSTSELRYSNCTELFQLIYDAIQKFTIICSMQGSALNIHLISDDKCSIGVGTGHTTDYTSTHGAALNQHIALAYVQMTVQGL
jgi:hypothetical protein